MFIRVTDKPFFSRVINQAALALVVVALSLSGCMKGSKSATDARGGGKFKATPGEVKASYAPNYTLETPIKFTITTLEGRPIPNVLTDFRAFDITASHQAGISDANLRSEMIAKWNDGNFIMNSNGVIDGSKCEAGFTREACVGILSGASSTTNQNGEASVGFSTPNSPGAVIAIAVKVPESSNAADLVEFVKIKLTTNEEFANSGIAPIQSVLLVIPILFDKDGQQVIKSGSTFNLAVYAPGIPNTEPGKGFSFDFTTTGSAGLLSAEGTTIPNGTLSCEFRNSQCIVPGGPFRILKPGSVSFAVKPTDPKFPVKPASLSLPVTIGDATELILSLTEADKGVTPVCPNRLDTTRECLSLTSGSDPVRIYPMLVDAGRNFVAYLETDWVLTDNSVLVGNITKETTSWKITPRKAGRGRIEIRPAGAESSTIPDVLTYEVLPGKPSRIEVVSENTNLAGYSEEKATDEFSARVTLYDEYDNVTTGFTGQIKLKLSLENALPASPPAGLFPSNQIPVEYAAITSVDHFTAPNSPVDIVNGVGLTQNKFRVERITQAGSAALSIQVDDSEIELADGTKAALTPKPKKEIKVIPGPTRYSLLRKLDQGGGGVWITEPQSSPAIGVKLRTDSEYFFFNAGYDGAGNYTLRDVPSKFFGIDFRINEGTALDAALNSLRALPEDQRNALSQKSGCPDPSPRANPEQPDVNGNIIPESTPTNMPLSLIYCGLHRGLSKKTGNDTVFRSAGIAGTGKILAIPDDPEIAPAITPKLTLTSGTATKYAFEYRDPETNAILSTSDSSFNDATRPDNHLYNKPLTAGQNFKVHILAVDADDLVSDGHEGIHTFTIIGSSNDSWGGIKPKVPNAFNTSASCDFSEPGIPLGHCELKTLAGAPAVYQFVDARTKSLISVEETTPGGLAGVHSDFVDVIASEPGRLYFASEKGRQLVNGGPQVDTKPETPLHVPTGRIVKVGETYQPWAIAIADMSGNWLADADMEKIVFEGFDSTINNVADKFNQNNGIWLNEPQYQASDLFIENNTPDLGLSATGKKFFNPAVANDQSEITLPYTSEIDTFAKFQEHFQIAYVPQNRTGNGFAVAKHVDHPTWISWPSPFLEVKPGKPEHVETILYAGPGIDPTPINSNVIASATCNTVRIFVHDGKHNQIDYTGRVTGAFKLFNQNSADPYAYDADDLTYNFGDLNSETVKTLYNNLNKAQMIGPFQDALEIPVASESEGGGALWSTANGFMRDRAPIKNWWAGPVNINSGEVSFPGKICLYNGQRADNGNIIAGVDKYFQVDLGPDLNRLKFPGVTSRGEGVRYYRGATEIGSTITGSSLAHQNHVKFRVNPGSADHLHPSFTDNDPTYQSTGGNWDELRKVTAPQINSASMDVSIGVTDTCPSWHCGETKVYWHTHDSAHNYLGPASTAGFQVVSGGNIPFVYDNTTGPRGAPQTTVFPPNSSRTLAETASNDGKYTLRVSNNQVDSTNASIFNVAAPNWSYKRGFDILAFPGPPKTLKAEQLVSGVLSTDTPFGLSLKLFDEFDNPAGGRGFERFNSDTRSDFSQNRNLKIFWNRLNTPGAAPSNAPIADPTSPVDNHKPLLMGSRNLHNNIGSALNQSIQRLSSARNFHVVYSGSSPSTSSLLVKSDEDVDINVDLIDTATIPWCDENPIVCCVKPLIPHPTTGVMQCPDAPGVKTFTLSPPLRLKAASGAPTSIAITNGQSFAAKEYKTDNYQAIFAPILNSLTEIYPLGPDTERVISTYACSKDQYGNIGDCFDPSNFSITDINGTNIAEIVGASSNTNVFRWYPKKPGSFQITATKNSFTTTTDTILVGALPLNQFSIENAITSTTPLVVDAGEIVQAEICMLDQAQNVITSPVIINNQLITTPTGKLKLNFTALGVSLNEELRNIEISKLGGNQFESLPLQSEHEFDFVDGCSPLFVKVLASGTYSNDILGVTYQDQNQQKNIVGQGLRVDTVRPLGLDHFVTTAERLSQFPIINSVEAWANPLPVSETNYADLTPNPGHRFDLVIYPRDVYGNRVSVSNQSVSLGLRDADAVIAGRFPVCPSNANCLTQPIDGNELRIQGLALDLGGKGIYVNATSGPKGISTRFSTLINTKSSLNTIKRYNVSAPAETLIQPSLTSLTVTAVDAGGQPIIGIQDLLNSPSLGYTWDIAMSDGSPYTVNTSRCTATLPRPNFIQSSATVTGIQLARIGNVKINIRDSQESPVSSSNASITQIKSASGQLTLRLSCTKQPGNIDCSGTEAQPYQIFGTPEDEFDLTLAAFDNCENPSTLPSQAAIKLETFRPGDFGANASPLPGRLESIDTTVDRGSEHIVKRDTPGQQSKTISRLYHRSANHNIKYTIDPSSTDFIAMLKNVYHKYYPAPGTVYVYRMLPVAPTTDFLSATTGTPISFNLIALDFVGQRVTGIDSHLNDRRFTWSGPSKAPNNEEPVLPSEQLSFTDGITSNTLTAIFKKEENINFMVVDDYTPGSSNVGGRGPNGTRQSEDLGTTAVIQGQPDRFEMKLTTQVGVDQNNRLMMETGKSFDVEITAFDQFGNIATNLGSTALEFRWSNASPSNIHSDLIGTGPGKLAPQQYTPRRPNDNTISFSSQNAKFTTTGGQFTLYRDSETPTLTVTAPGLIRSSNQQPVTAQLIFKTTNDGNTKYLRVTDSGAYSQAADMYNRNISMLAGQTKTFYAHAFDAFGNYVTLYNPARWYDYNFQSSIARPVLSQTSGGSTTFTGDGARTGYIEADCTQNGMYPDCIKGRTGNISVSPGVLQSFTAQVVSPSTMSPANNNINQTAIAGEEIQFDVCMRDSRENIILSDVYSSTNQLLTDADATLPIRITSNVQPSPEGNSIHLSTTSDFTQGLINLDDPSPKQITFNNGCIRLYAKVFGAKVYNNIALLNFSYQFNDSVTNELKTVTGVALRTLEIKPAPLDHFVTKVQQTANMPTPRSVPGWYDHSSSSEYAANGGNRFDVLVYARDIYGNDTKINGNISLSLASGTNRSPITNRRLWCDPATNQDSCRSASFNDSSSIVISKTAIDIGGRTLYVRATGLGKDTVYNYSDLINALASDKTVSYYTVSTPTEVEAGEPFVADVFAKDAAGEDVIGADEQLNAMNFSWLDQSGGPLTAHSIGGHQITAPINSNQGLQFTLGKASPRLTLVKAETGLLIGLKDGNDRTATNTRLTNVIAGRDTYYSVTCNKQLDHSPCNGSASSGVVTWHQIAASKSDENQFKLTVASLDYYGNEKIQISASPEIRLSVDGSSDAPLAGRLEQDLNPSTQATFSGARLFATMTNQHTVTIDKLFHRSGNHKITYDVAIPTGAAGGTISSVYHEYAPHPDMIFRYAITGIPATVVAGTDMPNVELTALDIAGNIVKGLDNVLRDQTYAWSGPTGTTPQQHTFDMGTKNFQNGKLTLTSVIFRKQEDIADLHVTASPIAIRSTPIGTRNIVADKPTKYALSGLPANPVAGNAYTLTVRAVDEFGNTNKNWSSDTLNYTLTNNADIISKDTSPNTTYSTLMPNNDTTSQAFTQGSRSVSGPFTFYNSNPTALGAKRIMTFKVTGTVTANTESGSALESDVLTMTVDPSTAKYVRIANSATYSDSTDVTGQTLDIDTALRPTFYSHVFDTYGNYLGNLTSSWSTSVPNLTITALSGVSTQLTTSTTASGSITATCTAGVNCNTNASVSVSIGTSPLAAFTLKYATEALNPPAAAPTFNAGEPIHLKLCMVDSSGNLITAKVGDPANPITDPDASLNITFDPRIAGNEENASAQFSLNSSFTSWNIYSQTQTVPFSQGCANVYVKIWSKNAASNTNLLSAYYTDNAQNKTIGGSGLKVSGITPGPLHRYVVSFGNAGSYTDGTQRTMRKAAAWSDPYTGSTYANDNNGNRFDVIVTARDQFGNTVNGAGNEITLTSVKENGTSFSPDRPLKCLSAEITSCNKGTITSNQTSVTIPNLAVDFGGQFLYIKATDTAGKTGGADNKSWLLWPETSFKTVSDYSISLSNAVFASAGTNVKIIARDNYGDKILRADTSLESGTWTWSDSKSNTPMTDPIHSVGGNNPSFGAISFTQGEANINAVFTKAETIRLALTNSNSLKLSVNVDDTVIYPGASTRYNITCLTQTNDTPCSGNVGSTYNLPASRTQGKFKLTVQALDDFGNNKSGARVPILLTHGNALNPSQLESTDSVQRNGSGQILADTQNSNGVATISHLYYHVPQPITYSISGQTTNISTYHSYTPHVDMVKDYAISGFSNVIAGVQTTFTIQAKDAGGNNAAGIANDLNLLNFSYPNRGTGTALLAPVGPATDKPQFDSSGSSQSVGITFKKSETISNFRSQDNHAIGNRFGQASSFIVQPAKPNRYVITPSAAGIQPKAGLNFGVTVTAMDEFDNAVSGWSDNLSFTWDLTPSTVTRDGTTYTPNLFTGATPANQWSATGSYATPSDFVIYRSHVTSTDISNSEKPILKVTGTATGSLTATNQPLTGTHTFAATLPNDTLSYVRVTKAKPYSDAGLLTQPEPVFADRNYNFYAFGFDAYGNFKGPQNVTWSGTGELDQKITAISGTPSEASMSPTTAPGNGTITASCSSPCQSYTSGNFEVKTGVGQNIVFTNPLNEVPATSLVSGRFYKIISTAGTDFTSAGASSNTIGVIFQANTNASSLQGSGTVTTNAFDSTTDSCTRIEVEIQDGKSNPVRATEDQLVIFGSNGGNGQFFASENDCFAAFVQANNNMQAPNTAVFDNSSSLTFVAPNTTNNIRRSVTLPANQERVSVWYANRSANENVTINAVVGSLTGSIIKNKVAAGIPRRVNFTTQSVTINSSSNASNNCGAITYSFRDKWDNPSPITSTASIRFQTTSATGTFFSGPGCTSQLSVINPTKTVPVTSGSLAQDTVHYSDINANLSTISILGIDGNGNARSQLAYDGNVHVNPVIETKTMTTTVLPGAFGFTSVSDQRLKYPFTIDWSESMGAKDYSLFYIAGANGTCAGTKTAAPGGVAINDSTRRATFSNGLADATYTLCLRANGHTGSTARTGEAQIASSTSANPIFASSINVIIDNGAPQFSNLSVVTATPGQTRNPTVSITLSEAANVVLYSDNSCQTPISSQTSFATGTLTRQLTTDELPLNYDGTIKAIATDSAGNSSSCTTIGSYRQDTVVPTVTTATIPRYGNSSTPAVTYTIGELSRVRLYNGNCTLANLISAANPSIVTTTSGTISTTTLASGDYDVRIQLEDAAGNTSTCATVGTHTYDNTAPQITAVSSTTADNTYRTGNISLTVTFNETVLVTGVPTLGLNVGSGRNATYAAGHSSSTLSFTYSIAAGDNSARLNYSNRSSLLLGTGINITDLSGNSYVVSNGLPETSTNGLSMIKNIIIDTRAPAIQTSTTPTIHGKNLSTSSTTRSSANLPDVVFTLDESATAVEIFSSDTCTAGTSLSASSTAAASTAKTITLTTAMTTATTPIRLRVQDAVGNVDCIQLGSYIFDNSAPTLSSASVGGKALSAGISARLNNATPSFSITLSEATKTGGARLWHGANCTTSSISNTFQGLTTPVSVSLSAFSFTANSPTVVRLSVEDDAGNTSCIELGTYIHDTTAPSVSGASQIGSSATFYDLSTSNIIRQNISSPVVKITFDEPISTAQLWRDSNCTANSISSTFTGGTATTDVAITPQTNADMDIFIKATDTANNTLNCARLGTYHHDTAAPGIKSGSTVTIGGVTLTSGQTSRRNNSTPSVQLTLDQDTTTNGMQLFSGSNCSTTPISATDTFTGTSVKTIPITVAFVANATATEIRLKTQDPAGNTSCIPLGQYVHDTNTPTISEITSSTANGTYTNGGSAIPITITFNETVNVSGSPKLRLNVASGGFDVEYASGSGTTTLTFNYTIQAGHTASDLNYLDTSSLILPSGSDIQDLAGNTLKTNTADLFATLPATNHASSLGSKKDIVIDTTSPTIGFVSISPSSPGKSATPTVTVSISENGTKLQLFSVAGCGSGALTTASGLINSGSQAQTTNSLANPSTTTIYGRVFDRASRVGTSTDGNSSSCVELVTYTRDDSAPIITNMPTNNVIKNSGFQLNPTVTDTHTATYQWTQTANTRNCNIQFSSSSSFASTSSTSSMINPWMRITECTSEFGQATVSLTATDQAGNSSSESRVIQWDAEAPAVSTLRVSNTSSNLSNAHYRSGQTIQLELTFAKTSGNPTGTNFSVNVTGTPRLQLSTGGYATYTSASNRILYFNYTVQNTDFAGTQRGQNLALFSGASIDLNGGTIKDNVDAGNNANLTSLPAGAFTAIQNTTPSNVVIDTTAPTSVVWSQNNIGSISKNHNPTVSACTTSGSGGGCDSENAKDVARVRYSYISGSTCESASFGITATQTSQTATSIPSITASISGLLDGDVVLCARGEDLAGNTQSGSTLHTWIKDTSPPAAVTGLNTWRDTTLTSIFDSSQSVTAKWTNVPVTNDARTDVTSIDVFMSRSAGCSATNILTGSTTLTPPASSYTISPTPTVDGRIYFCVFTSDVAGNKQLAASAAQTSYEIENDILHISWTDGGGVKYGKKDKLTNWNAKTVAPAGSGTFSGRTSLAIRNDNFAAVSYQLIDGSESYMRFRIDAPTNGFATERTPSLWGSSGILAGDFNDIAFNTVSTNTVLTAHVCRGVETDPISNLDVDVSYLCQSSGNTGTGQARVSSSITGQLRDVSYTVDSANVDYAIAASANGLYAANMSNGQSASVTRPSSCTDVAFVSTLSSSANNFGVAAACVMTNNSCKVFFSTFAFNANGMTPTWTELGTISASSCSLASLNEGDRPSITRDRINTGNPWSVTWMNRSTNQLMRWSQEIPVATSATQTEIVTTGASISDQTIAVDATGKTYIIYKDGNAVKLITNNARPDADKIGGWNVFLPNSGQAEIVSGTGVTGVGNIGISGMRGRSNTTGQ